MNARKLVVSIAMTLTAAAASAGTVDYSDANTPACSAAQTARFDLVHGKQSGLDVFDPDGYYIGWNEGDGIFWRNWAPVDAYKRTVCGTLHSYSFYNPWYSGDEDDANKYIVPAPGFERYITDPIAWGLSDDADVHRCGASRCMEAEITPDQSYAGNPWFPQVEGVGSVLTGKSMCNYGPWIADYGHGGRPEIHPSEGMWWVAAPTPAGILQQTRAVLMQDDSNRYDRRADFTPDLPSSIKPWSAWPRTAYVRHAFKLPLGSTAQEYLHVYETARIRNITTALNAALSGDATVGTTHTLRYNGVPRLNVVEHQNDADFGVVFDENAAAAGGTYDLCRRADGYLQGYATLRVQFGVDDRGGEGYDELVIDRATTAIDPAAASAKAADAAPGARRTARAEVDWSTVHVEPHRGRLRLVGDTLLTVDADSELAAVRTADGRALPLRLEQIKADGGGAVVRIPQTDLSTEHHVDVQFADGLAQRKRVPGLAVVADLDARVEATASVDAAALDRAWHAWAAAAGATRIARPASFAQIERWSIRAIPSFAATEDGKPSREEVSTLVERLNRAAADGDDRVLPLDRAASAVIWRLDGKRIDAAGSRWGRSVTSGNVGNGRLELVVLDAFGQRYRAQQPLPSHALVGDPAGLAAALPALVADLAGIAAAGTSDVDGEDAVHSPAAGKDRILRHLGALAARDGAVTTIELARLLAAARE